MQKVKKNAFNGFCLNKKLQHNYTKKGEKLQGYFYLFFKKYFSLYAQYIKNLYFWEGNTNLLYTLIFISTATEDISMRNLNISVTASFRNGISF